VLASFLNLHNGYRVGADCCGVVFIALDASHKPVSVPDDFRNIGGERMLRLSLTRVRVNAFPEVLLLADAEAVNDALADGWADVIRVGQ
jgi:hypothetical protein